MGSGNNKRGASNEKLVRVNTADLKERLNRFYKGMRSATGKRLDTGRFDYLWDLKELALLEGRQSVDIPESWLEEIEKSVGQDGIRQGH
jgi:hypothetical protein